MSTKTAAPTEGHTHKKTRKVKVGQLLTNVILVACIGGGAYWAHDHFARFEANEVTNDAQVEEFINPINSRIGGYIKSIRFTEHQAVKKGDTLVVIDDRELKIQVAQAEAAYLEAQAGQGVTNSSINTVRNNTSVADANLAEMKVRLANAEQNYNRYVNLLKDESVSRQQFEMVSTEYEAMKAKYKALLTQRQSTELATSEVSKRLTVNAAGIKRAQAALDMARLNLSYTVITAPYDGYVGRRTLQEGQLIQPGQALVSIVRDDQKWITANYKETQMSHLRIGQSVNIKVDALEGKNFKGTVTAIAQATGSKFSLVPTDNSTGNFVKVQQRIPVRIDLEGNSSEDLKLLRAGMNVEVEAKKL
ncbi:hemolysin D [Siphonobacter sp. SORGH_AS_0500]|uniref:HlyD family secretion protein n=1 Tax=Siphonobacter sp. SORGH_AS_0500 TaxID=1864824 RepID=UPI000CB86CEF|nr:HlyD family secretion protein [Siphonobacter sp. SORGH_AS_0500]PKK36179.1 hemolysin D [Siphonobacter sp. SORGH_AS_0500]